MKKGIKYLAVFFSVVFLLTILIPAQSLISQEQADKIQLISVTPSAGTVIQRGTSVPFEVTFAYNLVSVPEGFVDAELALPNGACVFIGDKIEIRQGSGTVVIKGSVDVERLYNWVNKWVETETDTVYLALSLSYWYSDSKDEAGALDYKCLTEYPYYIEGEAPPENQLPAADEGEDQPVIEGEAPSFEKHLRITTRPYLPIAELTVNYEWVDKSGGENIYKVSKIQIKLVGFTGVYQLFIRDRYKNTLWSDWGWCRINLTKSYPLEDAPFTVGDSCEISISLGGVDDITALVKPLLKSTDWYVKGAEKLLAGPYAILIPHNVIYDMFKQEDVKIWEALPIAFAKSSTTQFYPDSPVNISSNIRDFFVNAYNNVKELIKYILKSNTAPAPPDLIFPYRPNGEDIVSNEPAQVGTFVFKDIMMDEEGDNVKLQMELKPFNESFTGSPNYESKWVKGYNNPIPLETSPDECVWNPDFQEYVASISVYLTEGKYHWQLRAIDENGAASSWVIFYNIDDFEYEYLEVAK